MIEHENIIGKVNKKMQSSKGMIKFIRALELTIRIEGRLHKKNINAYLICDDLPILWKKHYSKIAHDTYYKHTQHCSESYFHDFIKRNGSF